MDLSNPVIIPDTGTGITSGLLLLGIVVASIVLIVINNKERGEK